MTGSEATQTASKEQHMLVHLWASYPPRTIRSLIAAPVIRIKLSITIIASTMGPSCRRVGVWRDAACLVPSAVQAQQEHLKTSAGSTAADQPNSTPPHQLVTRPAQPGAHLVVKEADLLAPNELGAPVEGEERVGDHEDGHRQQRERDQLNRALQEGERTQTEKRPAVGAAAKHGRVARWWPTPTGASSSISTQRPAAAPCPHPSGQPRPTSSPPPG